MCVRRPLTLAQVVALFRDKPLAFRPGTRWSYSNSGYVLLGYLIERLSGMPYARFLQRYVLTPLRLRATGEGSMPPATGPYATGYASWPQPAFYERNAYAAGDLYSTVEDLYCWDRALTCGHPAIVSTQARRALFTPYVSTDPADPQAVSYGYGWFTGAEGAHREVEHTGEISGFLSANQWYPDDQLTVIVLSNLASDQGLRALTIALAGIALGYADCSSLQAPCTEL
jgi:CubicO group peptidase (beta-lactamase class C family)